MYKKRFHYSKTYKCLKNTLNIWIDLLKLSVYYNWTTKYYNQLVRYYVEKHWKNTYLVGIYIFCNKIFLVLENVPVYNNSIETPVLLMFLSTKWNKNLKPDKKWQSFYLPF